MAFTSIPSALQTYHANEKVQVTVTFSEPVYVVTTDGTPQIALTIDTDEQQATYETGSTTNALVFGYTVQSADTDTNGIEIKKDTLDANNGTIQDAAGNNAVLTHDAVPTDSTRKVDGSIVNQATAPPAPTLDEPSGTSNTGFTITWKTGAFVAGTHKKSDGDPLTSAEVSYKLYYAASADASTLDTTDKIKAVAKQAAADSAATGGVETAAAGAALSKTVSGKAFIGTVYMVIEAINTDDPSKTAPSGTKSYPITGLADKGITPPSPPPLAPTTYTLTPGKTKLTVNVTAITNFGIKKADASVALDADTVTYIFYYAKTGVAFDVDGTSTKVEAAGVTADHMFTTLKTLANDGSGNTKDKGKVILIAITGIGTPKEVPGLLGLTKYYYTIRVQETADATHGSNTLKASTTTKSAATKSHAIKTAAVATYMSYDTPLQITFLPFSIGGMRSEFELGRHADGSYVVHTEARYRLYYAKVGATKNGVTVTTTTTADKVIEAVGTATDDTDKDAGRSALFSIRGRVGYTLKDLTAGTVYRITIVTVHPDGGGTLNSAPSTAETTDAVR